MKKLTKEDILSFPMTSFGRSIGKQLASQVVQELLGYKQLEEQIGCPLEVLVKIFGNPVYVEDNNGKIVKLDSALTINQKQSGELIFNDDSSNYFYYVNDYKKTWWLKEDKSE